MVQQKASINIYKKVTWFHLLELKMYLTRRSHKCHQTRNGSFMPSCVSSYKLHETSISHKAMDIHSQHDRQFGEKANLPCHHWKYSDNTIWSTKSNKRNITNSRSRKEFHTERAIGGDKKTEHKICQKQKQKLQVC